MNPIGRGEEVVREAQALITAHRADGLWFLGEGKLPDDPERLAELLRELELHADRTTFIQSRRLRKCLSQSSSGRSAGS